MTKIIQGKRIGKSASLIAGSSAVIFNPTRKKVLLTKRADNERWCIPGGHMEPGESAAETCMREVKEETGLLVRVVRLIGVYTSPDRIIEYPDGNRIQPVAFHFEAEWIAGELSTSDETIACGYYSLSEIKKMDFMEHLRERILDSFANQEAAFIR